MFVESLYPCLVAADAARNGSATAYGLGDAMRRHGRPFRLSSSYEKKVRILEATPLANDLQSLIGSNSACLTARIDFCRRSDTVRTLAVLQHSIPATQHSETQLPRSPNLFERLQKFTGSPNDSFVFLQA